MAHERPHVDRMPESSLSPDRSAELAALAPEGPERILRDMHDRWLEDFAARESRDERDANLRWLLGSGSISVVPFPSLVRRAGDVVELADMEALPRPA